MTIHEAAYAGNFPELARCLEAGADPNDVSDPGWTHGSGAGKSPLHCIAVAWTMAPDR